MTPVERLAARIAARLRTLRDTGEGDNVQVGGYYYQLESFGEGLLLIELVANEFLPDDLRLDAAAEQRLAELGLRRPDDHWPNWALRLEDPTDADLDAAAHTVATALVEVYRVASGRRQAQLRHVRDDQGNTFSLDVRLLDDGSVEFAAQDLGPITAPVSDDGEYEYWRTIAAEHVPQLVWLLGGEPGEHVIELLARHWSGGERSFDLEGVLRQAPFPIRLFTH